MVKIVFLIEKWISIHDAMYRVDDRLWIGSFHSNDLEAMKSTFTVQYLFIPTPGAFKRITHHFFTSDIILHNDPPTNLCAVASMTPLFH